MLHKLSCSTWGFARWDLEDAISAMREVGFEGVEIVTHRLGPSGKYHLRPEFPEERIEEIEGLLGSKGLKLVCLSPASDFLKPTTGSLEGDIQEVKNNIDLAVKMGCPLVRPFATSIKPKEISRGKAIQTIVQSLKECAIHGEAVGVKLALENHGIFPAVPKNFIDIIKGVDSDHLGACLHTREGCMEILKGVPEKIFHLHLMDGLPIPKNYMKIRVLRFEGKSPDEIALTLKISEETVEKALSWRPKPVSLGEGKIDFKTVLSSLLSVGYSGWLNYEGHNHAEPVEDAKKSYSFLLKLLEKLQ